MTQSAKCPRCGKKTETACAGNAHTWYCHGCKQAFEDVDDGLVGYRRPETNAAMLERLEAKRKAESRKRRARRWTD